MPITSILFLIYVAAIVLYVIGVTKKIKALKAAGTLLLLIGIIATALLVLALNSM